MRRGRRRRGAVEQLLEAGRGTGLLEEGDLVVLTAGTAVNIPGTTDMIKLAYA